jgi:predicted transcriptional regulator
MTATEFVSARKLLGLTQVAWGRELGISTAHVARIEGGGTPVTPTLAILVRLLLHGRPHGHPGLPASS